MYRRTSIVVLLCAAAAAGGDPRLALDDFGYETAAEVQAAWKPGSGAPPPRLDRAGPSPSVVFPLPFSTLEERAFWDRTVSLDLANRGWFEIGAGIDEPSAVSHLSIYFESPPGWYAAAVPLERGRSVVTVRRSAFRPDSGGTPPGPWSRIVRIRISPWKGESRNASLSLHKLDAIRPDVVVVEPASLIRSGHREAQSLRRMTASTLEALEEAGIEACAAEDVEIADGALRDVRIAILPLNYSVPSNANARLREFVEGGGKLIAFYPAPPPIAELLGIREVRWRRGKEGELHAIAFARDALRGLPPTVTQRSWNCHVFEPARKDAAVIGRWRTRAGVDTGINAVIMSDTGIHIGHVLTAEDPVERTALLLALVGHFMPEAWRRAGTRAVERARSLEGVDGVEGLRRFLAERDAGEAARAELAAGEALLKRAEAALGAPEAPALASQAHDAFLEALARAFRPRPREIRAAWCHSAYGIEGLTWDDALRALAGAGFNAIVPNMLWAGVADYPSEVLPVRDRVATEGDQIALCLEAARRHGIEVHVWKVNWNLSGAPKDFVEKLRAAGRLQVDAAGRPVRWLCPSHQENFILERDSMLEVARKYEVAGLHFDYIRYPDRESCFCPTCRAAFEKRNGGKVARWPQDVRSGPLRDRFLQYRRDTITRLVRAVALEARKLRPGIKISAAVFPDWDTCREERGQDWGRWIADGLLDFVCPMNYTPSRAKFAELVARQIAWAGGAVPVVPGLGLSVHPRDLTPDRLLWMIEDARRLGAGGFTIFQYDVNLLWRHLPLLRMGATAPEAKRSP